MDQPTYVQLSDKNKPNVPKKKRVPIIDPTKTVEVENVSIDYSKWKVNDLIQTYVDQISGANKAIEIPAPGIQLPTVEDQDDYDHGRRLADIYGKFIEKFAELEIQATGLD